MYEEVAHDILGALVAKLLNGCGPDTESDLKRMREDEFGLLVDHKSLMGMQITEKVSVYICKCRV